MKKKSYYNYQSQTIVKDESNTTCTEKLALNLPDIIISNKKRNTQQKVNEVMIRKYWELSE